MAKHTLTDEEEERLRALTLEQRSQKFADIEKEIELSEGRIADVRGAERDLIGAAKAQRKFLASL